jgi:hypothetical protein
MRRLLLHALLFAAPAAVAATPPSFIYEVVTAHSPTGTSRLTLTPLGDAEYAIDFRIVVPNPTQHKGHIQGLATRTGERLTLRVPSFMENGRPEDPPVCTLVIDATPTRAHVVSAHKCTGFHGAAASFFEQGQDLLRVL